jgi:methylated-DNA-[protein]-cysteine S-methyltransferase
MAAPLERHSTVNPKIDNPDISTFLQSSAISASQQDRLHRRLEIAAAKDGLLAVSYRTIDSPVGPLLLAATERGLVRVAYEKEGFDTVLEGLAETISPRILRSEQRLDRPAFQLDEYFSGRRTGFDLSLDHALSTGFRLEVQRYLPSIGFGQTLSYAKVASLVGHARAARAVGSACATNPHPIVVPCHRVIRTDGTIGDYLGGTNVKEALLTFESTGLLQIR